MGKTDKSNALVRGGPQVRIIEDGRLLLLASPSNCHDITPRFSDGHGIEIPIVQEIIYDPQYIDPDLLSLKMTGQVTDFEARQDASARLFHLTRALHFYWHSETDDYGCVSRGKSEFDSVACALANPFGDPLPVMVNCKDETCSLPVLRIGDATMIAATWKRPKQSDTNPDTQQRSAVGEGSVAMLSRIQHYLDERMSR